MLVNQQLWIQNSMVKNSVLFGNSLDVPQYRSVLFACALVADFRDFPHRDKTLYVGQMAWVAISRAVYQNKCIYILDDVLSAVEVLVARHIMRYCIHELSVGKSVIIISNTLKLLTKINWMILGDNGIIKDQGPSSVVFSNFVDSIQSSDFISKYPPFDVFSTSSPGSHIVPESNLWLSTSSAVDQVSHLRDSRLDYQGFVDPLKLFAQVLVLRDVPSVNLGLVVIDPGTKFYLIVYSVLTKFNVMFSLLCVFSFDDGGMCTARDIHRKLLCSVLLAFLVKYLMLCIAWRHANMVAAGLLPTVEILDLILYAKITFFDMSSLGRIAVDDSLPFQMNIFLVQLFRYLGSVFVTLYGFSWILLLYIPLSLIYYTVQLYCQHTSRDLMILCSISLSPLYAHFMETLRVFPTIRAVRAVHRFAVRGDSLLVSQCVQFDIQAAFQWINLFDLTVLLGFSIWTLIQHHILTIECGQQYLEGAKGEKGEGIGVSSYAWPSHGSFHFQDICLGCQSHGLYSLEIETVCAIPEYLWTINCRNLKAVAHRILLRKSHNSIKQLLLDKLRLVRYLVLKIHFSILFQYSHY